MEIKEGQLVEILPLCDEPIRSEEEWDWSNLGILIAIDKIMYAVFYFSEEGIIYPITLGDSDFAIRLSINSHHPGYYICEYWEEAVKDTRDTIANADNHEILGFSGELLTRLVDRFETLLKEKQDVYCRDPGSPS